MCMCHFWLLSVPGTQLAGSLRQLCGVSMSSSVIYSVFEGYFEALRYVAQCEQAHVCFGEVCLGARESVCER